jgi:hypothetical protein
MKIERFNNDWDFVYHGSEEGESDIGMIEKVQYKNTRTGEAGEKNVLYHAHATIPVHLNGGKSEGSKVIGKFTSKDKAASAIKKFHQDTKQAGPKHPGTAITESKFDDLNHPSFKRGVELGKYYSGQGDDTYKNFLKRTDTEIEQHQDKHFNLMKDNMEKVLLGSQVAREKIERSADHLEHLHRLRAGMRSVVSESVEKAPLTEMTEPQLLTAAMDSLLAGQTGSLLFEDSKD